MSDLILSQWYTLDITWNYLKIIAIYFVLISFLTQFNKLLCVSFIIQVVGVLVTIRSVPYFNFIYFLPHITHAQIGWKPANTCWNLNMFGFDTNRKLLIQQCIITFIEIVCTNWIKNDILNFLQNETKANVNLNFFSQGYKCLISKKAPEPFYLFRKEL